MEISKEEASRVSAKLEECGLAHYSVEVANGRFCVRITRGMYDSAEWSYDNLAKFSALIGTTKINFSWNSGWVGSEDTPGDPAEYYCWIG